MKLIPLSLAFILVACSSTPNKEKSKPVDEISSSDFKKDKPLQPKEVSDFYSVGPKSLSPALEDETLDRYTAEEIAQLADMNDPLLELSVRCSKRDFEKAFGLASRIFNKYQKIAAYWNQVANCHLNQGSHRKALLFYNKALEVSPGYVPALNNIGVLYSRQGQDQKALVAFERANAQSKFAKTPRYNLAKTYLTYGMAEPALPIFQGLLSTSPADVDLNYAVGSCYFLMSDYQRALSYYQKIPSGLWENAEYGLNISLALKKVGRSDDAKKVFGSVDKPKSHELKQYYSSIAAQLGEGK